MSGKYQSTFNQQCKELLSISYCNTLPCVHADHLINALTVTHCSAEGDEFIVSRECVMCSGTIRALLTGPGQWAEQSGPLPTVHFESIATPVLEKVIQYFYFKRRYDGQPPPIPAFPIDMDNVVKVLLAANFLDT